LISQEKPFFFGKKNQKTFVSLLVRDTGSAMPLSDKVFLFLFLQKKKASSPPTIRAPA